MRRRRITAIIAVLLIAGILQGGYLIHLSTKENGTPKAGSQRTALMGKNVNDEKVTGNPVTTEEAAKVKQPPRPEADTSRIQVDEEIEKGIRSLSGESADKNIKNYKRALVEFNVDKRFRQEIDKEIKKGYPLPDLLTAYDFLNENYGHIDELGKLLEKREAGASWVEVFEEYNRAHPEFKPRNFEPGYLEKVRKETGATADDIMIADRVSQQGYRSLEELLTLKKEGRTWAEINAELGIVNTQEKLPRVAVTSGQVKKIIEEKQMTEEQAIAALVIAQKTGTEENEVITKVKEGKKKEEIYMDAYERKYK